MGYGTEETKGGSEKETDYDIAIAFKDLVRLSIAVETDQATEEIQGQSSMHVLKSTNARCAKDFLRQEKDDEETKAGSCETVKVVD